jgi:hypothetical protein
MALVRRLALTVTLLSILNGCATTQPASVGSPPTGAGELVFRVVELPGLLSPGESLRIPRISLYGDGALIMGDTAPATFPRPTQRRLTAVGVRHVVQAAADAGLTNRTDYGTPQLADAGTSVFTVVTTTRVDTTIVAPTLVEGLTTSQRDARERLRSLLTKLADLDTWLGNDITKGSQPYPYTQLAVFAVPQEPNPGATQQLWPLGDLATAGNAHGLGRCQIVTDAELDTIRNAAASTTPNTQWRSGDQLFHIVLRPLLRDEQTCHDLGNQ